MVSDLSPLLPCPSLSLSSYCLQAEVDSLKQQLSAKAEEAAQIQQQMESQQQQASSRLLQEQQLVKQLEAKLAASKQQHGASSPAPSSPAPAPIPEPAPVPDMSPMLEMMEAQLGRLSEIIRVREAEVTQLRMAVTAGCDERRGLQQQLAQAQEQLAATEAAAAVAMGNAGAGGSPGLQLPRPIRGPISKPKFRG